MSNFYKVLDFHDKTNSFIGERLEKMSSSDVYSNITPERMVLRGSLLDEEVSEVHKATTVNNLIKELCDVLYVTYGFLIELGVDADKAFDEVHNSNMSKLGADGKPILREDGKILKGPNYKPVDEKIFGRKDFNIEKA